MSDLADVSVNSHISSPLYSSTLNSISGDVTRILSDKSEQPHHQQRIMNNKKTNAENSDLVKAKNDHNLMTKNNNYSEKSEYRDRPLKLKVVIKNADSNGRVMNVLNDLSKAQSPIVEKNSVDFITNGKESGGKTYGNKPVMGRNALFKKANIEQNDSLVIYDLVTEKYNGLINHYLDRSSRRRRLRSETSETCSDTVYSSPPAYSPLSLSSIGTGESCGPDEKTGFRFPVPGYSSLKPSIAVVASPEGVKEALNENDEIELPKDEVPDKNYLKFLVSTDETNIETTAEDIDSSAISARSTEQSSTSFSDYDPEKFLDQALGELTDVSNAHRVPNEKSEEVKQKASDQQQDDGSIGTSNLSTLLSTASSLYTYQTTLRKPCSIRSLVQLPEISENDGMALSRDNSYLEQLMKELSLQNEILFQVSKALNYCRMTKKFESSVELLEAEKVLLVASCTKEALTKEIQSVEENPYEQHNDSICHGEVMLTSLTFYSKDYHKSDTHRDFTEYFLIVLTCGNVVLASEIVTADETGEVRVQKTFGFSDLAPDFEISVCIYAMRVENKLHANQEPGKTNCPSPKKIFFHLRKGIRKYKVLNDVVYIKPSSFTLRGKCQLRNRDLPKSKNNDIVTLNMVNTPLSSSLSGTFSVKIKTDVKLTNRVSEFLTIGTDNEHGCTIWNRRWCILEGSTLKYWNYPSEEVSSPLGSIDLSKCLAHLIRVADRTICPRPRTLMVPIKQNDSEKKYLLSADDCSSMEQWETEINSVLSSLRVWNRIDV